MPLTPLYYPQIKQTNFANLQEFAPEQVKILDDFLNDITQKDVDFLNTFNPDKLLYNFRVTAGLPNTKASSSYSGWENTRIGGHTIGHYLAAVGQALARGYGECKGSDGVSLQARFDYIIDGLEECQKALGTGFIFGATMEDPSKPERQFDRLEEGNPADTWVPWYTVHKIINGLVEANKSGGSKKALEIGVNFAQWIYARTNRWDDETQARVLATEYGGMNDCLYELYKCAKAGGYDETVCEKILASAHKFDEIPLFEKVRAAGPNANVLNNRHANTTIPKFVGAMNRYMTLNGEGPFESLRDPEYLDYAKAFWKIVVNNHTYITGGNSECEHFGADNILDKERSNTNCETCNTHNMLKLSRMLFMATGERQYADYYENTFINAILASVNAETGMTLYFQPMATGCFKTYCNPDVDKNYFWCCTGTGLENFTKLGDSIYFHDSNTLVVNQFISSRVEWKEKDFALSQKADLLNNEKVEFVVENAPNGQKTTFAVRSPDWNHQKTEVFINEKPVQEALDYKIDSGYIIFTRNWQTGDKISVKYNMNIQAFPLPDNGQKAVAFKYGPVVLAAELGKDDKMTLRQVGVQCDVSANKLVCGDLYELTGNYGGTSNLPLLPGETVLVKDSTVQDFLQDINSHFEKISRPDGILAFRLKDTSWQGDFIFSPYYLINNQRYGIYWIFANKLEQSLEHNAFSTNSKGERTMFIEGIGIGYGAQTEGNATTYPFMQEKGTGSVGDPNELTRYANAGGSFSYIFKVKPGKKNYLKCTFLKEDNGKTICITSGLRKIAAITLNYQGDDEKYTMEFELPKGLTKKEEVRISFMGIKNAASARLCSPVNTMYSN
ncbi:MAG: glycoside hydrolase family 127 protein [Treponema sp.]|nr:glycoside hydrolase family 127 protein [Treponema sp.]